MAISVTYCINAWFVLVLLLLSYIIVVLTNSPGGIQLNPQYNHTSVQYNIAKYGKATQDNVSWGGVPEKAIDGNTNPYYFQGYVLLISNKQISQVAPKSLKNQKLVSQETQPRHLIILIIIPFINFLILLKIMFFL